MVFVCPCDDSVRNRSIVEVDVEVVVVVVVVAAVLMEKSLVDHHN